MKHKMTLRTAAVTLAVFLAACAVPAAPFAEIRLPDLSITAHAEDEQAWKISYDAETGTMQLSGDFSEGEGRNTPPINDLNEKMSEYAPVKLTCAENTVFPAYSHSLFAENETLVEIDFTGADFSKVTNAYGMFRACRNLKKVTLDETDFSAVTDMEYMFDSCKALESVSGLNSSSPVLTNVYRLFGDCRALKRIDNLSLTGGGIEIFSRMFIDCQSLSSLDLSNVNTSSAISFVGMFEDCRSLRKLDLTSFDTSNVTTMYHMFFNCYSLISVDFSSFQTKKLENMEGMFLECTELISADLSTFDTSSVTTMANMFADCHMLQSVNLSSFDTTNCTSFSSMFYYCRLLSKLNLSSFTIQNPNSQAGGMFYGMYQLRELKLGSGIQKVTQSMNLWYTTYGWVDQDDPETLLVGPQQIGEFDNNGEHTYIGLKAGEFTGVRMQLLKDGYFGMKFDFCLTDVLTQAEKDAADLNLRIYMTDTPYQDITPVRNDDGTYSFTVKLSPKQLADQIWINLQVNGRTESQFLYTARQYADYLLTNSEQYPAEQDLMLAMLHYGGAAQLYFNHQFDLANGIESYNADRGISYSRSGFNKAENFVKPDDITGLEYYGTSLMLGTGTSPRHYFKLTGGTIGDFKFTVGGKTVTAVQKDDSDLYYITARDNSSAKNLYTPSDIQVIRKDDPSQDMVFSYSAMDYVTRGLELNSFDEKGKKFATALGWFADAAKAYFDLV